MNKISDYEISSLDKFIVGAALLRFNPLTQAAFSDILLKTGNLSLRLLFPAVSTLFVAVAAFFVCKYAINYFLDSTCGEKLKATKQKIADVANKALELGSDVAVEAAIVTHQAVQGLDEVASRDAENTVSLESLGGELLVEEEDNGLSFLSNLFTEEETAKKPQPPLTRFETTPKTVEPRIPGLEERRRERFIQEARLRQLEEETERTSLSFL